MHPHQLRHTLATQAINRGMSLEAIAALLGHRSMRMTLTYARISDRTVADEYFRVTEAVETSYRDATPIPNDVDGPNMRRLAADHRRLLGNGHCTRPVALDCNFETICERCGFFETGPQFVEIIQRQRDHAAGNDQHDRARALHPPARRHRQHQLNRASMTSSAPQDHPCNSTLVGSGERLVPRARGKAPARRLQRPKGSHERFLFWCLDGMLAVVRPHPRDGTVGGVAVDDRQTGERRARAAVRA